MKQRLIVLSVLAAAFLLAVGSAAVRRAYANPNKVHVHGVVYDEQGHPLEGVFIVIVPSNANSVGNVLTTKTDKDGKYEITDTIDGSFDILYRNALLGSVSVSRLSNAGNQEIAKVLDREPTSTAKFEALQGLEHYAFLVELKRMRNGYEDLPRLEVALKLTTDLVSQKDPNERIQNYLAARVNFVGRQIQSGRLGG